MTLHPMVLAVGVAVVHPDAIVVDAGEWCWGTGLHGG